jgi:hypothetical protein
MHCGLWSVMSFRSIVTKPYTAFVERPSGPVNPRIAWYARYIWLLPSMRNRVGFDKESEAI